MTKKSVWICVALLGAVVLFYLFDPSAYRLFPKCPFKLITGWSCPGCGIQRALHAMLHGRVGEALAYNPFLVYAVPYLLCVVATDRLLKGEWQTKWRNVFEGRTAALTYVALYVSWGVVRNVYEW